MHRPADRSSSSAPARLRRRTALLALLSLVATLLVGIGTAAPAHATHFRYRDLSWTRVDAGTLGLHEVDVRLKVADRRSYYGSPIVGETWSEEIDFGDGTSGRLSGRVVSVNTIDDWFVAEVTGRHTYFSSGPFTLNWSSCCTLSTLNNSSDSYLRSRAVIDLRGGNTASPVTSVSPIVNLSAGGTRSFRIAARDSDGDLLSYRLATPAESNVTQPPDLSVDSRSGTVTWPTDGKRFGLWLTTVVVSDGRGAETQTSFLIDLGGTAAAAPYWEDPTPTDRTVFDVRRGETETFVLRAADPSGEPVTINDLGLPAGMTCTSGTDGAASLRTCSFTPPAAGFHLVSFDAQDPQGGSAGVRTFAVGAGRYVALGDSYSAGEGVQPYEEGTDTASNQCHRSESEAYSRAVSTSPTAPSYYDFVACSGARTYDYYDGGQYDEREQLSEQNLGDDVQLVTMTIGGNDAGFTSVLKECTLGFELLPFNNCSGDEEKADNPVDRQFSYLEGTAADTDPEDGGITRSLDTVYSDLRRKAPKARVLVLGYPQFYKSGGTLFLPCSGISSTDQEWVNSKVRQMNELVERKALAHGFEFVETSSRFSTHRLCEIGGGGDREWFYDIQVDPIPSPPFARVDEASYHPTEEGHAAMAAAVLDALSRPAPSRLFMVQQGQTYSSDVTVAPGQDLLNLNSSWPGSDVVMSLTSPSGRTIDRATVAGDVTHEVGPTFERYAVHHPEPGAWRVDLYGADVSPDGEPTRLVVSQDAPVNARPQARISKTLTGSTVRVDATGSSDRDGRLIEYEFDFGDGTRISGPTAEHTYGVQGRYDVSVRVVDDRGGVDFASTGGFEVGGLRFSGFDAPVDRAPTRNLTQAGQTVPLKWRITDVEGRPVDDPASFVAVVSSQVSCDTGAPLNVTETSGASAAGLQHHGDGRWSFTWQTSKNWAGSCRVLLLRLQDGQTSGRTAVFQFR